MDPEFSTMRTFETRVTIAAPPVRVWSVLADLERWPTWTPSMRSLERLDPGPLGPGARVLVRQPKLLPATFTITEWRPERSFAWIARSPGLRAFADHRIDACPEGSEVTLLLRYEGALSAVVALLLGPLTRRYMALEAAGLKIASTEPGSFLLNSSPPRG